MEILENLKYSEDHEWIKVSDDGTARIGITDFAQSELGELVYIEVDTVGDTISKGELFGTVEAVKTTSDLFMPVSGEVLEFNPELSEDEGDNPGIINEDPYDKGWIIKIKVQDICELDELLDADAYKALVL